jgi:hypothetical protein
MTMKKLLFAMGVALSAVTGVMGQEMRHNRNIEGAFQVQATYRDYDMSHLNSALNAGGVPSVGSNAVWIDLSMSHVYKKWITEDGIGATPMTTSEANGVKTRFNQYQAFFKLGYNVSMSPDYRLYPFAGVNFTAAVLNVEDDKREQTVSNFSQELLNSTSSKTLFQPNFGIDLGLGFDYLIKLKPKKTAFANVERNIPIGIRAGYYFNTYASNWKINDYNLNNGPNDKQSAVFLTFNIGLGYKVSK